MFLTKGLEILFFYFPRSAFLNFKLLLPLVWRRHVDVIVDLGFVRRLSFVGLQGVKIDLHRGGLHVTNCGEQCGGDQCPCFQFVDVVLMCVFFWIANTLCVEFSGNLLAREWALPCCAFVCHF